MAIIVDYLANGLREEGYSVEDARDGICAWNRLLTSSWNLELLDWLLPGLDGLTLLRRFRERDSRTPVLFLTARDQVQCRVLGLDSGADDYLCKPFDFDELLARVRVLIRRCDDEDAPVSYGDVTVDLAAHRAERAAWPLDLSAKELGLLSFLMRNPGRVLARDRIYEHVWKDRYDGESNTLGVHIMGLRHKLEALGPRLIHTLRGRGYYFGAAPRGEPEKAG